MEIVVDFPGGKRVDATFGGFTIHTDQPVAAGGEGAAPDPFSLFLASIATCAGIYVVGFCQARNIPLDGVRLIERTTKDPTTGRLTHIALEIEVPPSFPPQYREPLARAAAACKVKKTLADPPVFDVVTTVHPAQAIPIVA